ncbi:Hypothetical predicted protein [Cloeon dipterum]|uniref:G-protein coupled receptors family 3 profile domain-containing protein n=2 Tax=Cloeon dipterum TaxID=197152 RepID=A0A8S1D363_9INSE|nr:Hypothetical predicted protein [Cloeon dipterum]
MRVSQVHMLLAATLLVGCDALADAGGNVAVQLRHEKSKKVHQQQSRHHTKQRDDDWSTTQQPPSSSSKTRRSQNSKVMPQLVAEVVKSSSGAPNLENKMLAYENVDSESNNTAAEPKRTTGRKTFDIVTRFLRIVETQHLMGDNCTAGTDLNLGEGVVDRYAQERFRVEAEVAVNRANTLTRLWKYASRVVMESEYLLHAGVRALVDFDDDIFAAGNCYDQNQYKDYWLFCPYAYRLPEGPILAKDLAVEYKYLSNSSEWFYIARKNAERVIVANKQFSRGYNTYTHNESAHSAREPDEILAVTYEDGHWSKPYYDCGGANIWMLTYTVPFFGFDPKTGKYYFKGTSGIDIDLRRVDIDQCPLPMESSELNIFAATDKCKIETTECVPVPGLGFRRGSYKCVCRRGFYYPDVLSQNRYFNGTVIEEEYEKYMMGEESRYTQASTFECLRCADGCDACIDASPCVLALNWAMRSAVLGLSLVPVLCLPVVVWFTCRYGHVKVVRAASPVLLRVIALGAFLIYCTTIVMYPQPNMITCSLRVWLREIGFSLTYGALMLKTWRISVIFRVRSAKAVRITDMDLLKRLGFIVGAFAALLLMRTLVAPPPVVVAKSADDLKAFLCRTDWWDHSFSLMEVVLLVWGIWLCIGVRKAPSEFNESRFISMAIYNEFLLSIFLNISMLFLQSPANPDLLYVIFFSHTQLTVTMLLCFIFGSKAYMVYKGQGKLEEHGVGSYGTKPTQTAIKFLTAGSRHSPRGSPNRTMYGGATPQAYSNTPSSAALPTLELNGDPNLELDRLSSQLELLRQRHVKMGTNRRVLCKIAAIQRVIGEVDDEDGDDSPIESRDGHSLNNVIAAVTDKIVCAAMGRVDSVDNADESQELDMTVESAALNRSLTKLANSTITLDDKTHFTNEISV